MQCCDCNKPLKGGFGCGPRPFKLFRCADCVMEVVDINGVIHGMQLITDIINEPVKNDRSVLELKDKLDKIKMLSTYYKDKKAESVCTTTSELDLKQTATTRTFLGPQI